MSLLLNLAVVIFHLCITGLSLSTKPAMPSPKLVGNLQVANLLDTSPARPMSLQL